MEGSRGLVIQDNQNSPNTPAPQVCADVSGNSFTNIVGQAGDGTWMRLRRLNGTFRVRQAAPTGAANIAELDDANEINDPTKFAISGTIAFSGGTCPTPP